jgi:hypothetical protein
MPGIAVFGIVVAAACCGLCIYAISRAVRRSKDRERNREADKLILMHR